MLRLLGAGERARTAQRARTPQRVGTARRGATVSRAGRSGISERTSADRGVERVLLSVRADNMLRRIRQAILLWDGGRDHKLELRLSVNGHRCRDVRTKGC